MVEWVGACASRLTETLLTDAAKKFVVIEAPEYDCHGLGFDPLADFFRESHPELLEMMCVTALSLAPMHAPSD